MTEPTRRVIGYVRVSTDEQEQEGASLDAQRRAITEECQRRAWTLVRIEEDVASGKDMKEKHRPGLDRAITAVSKRHRRSREADALMVAKLDRLSRSLHDFAGLLERSKTQGWTLVTLDMALDTATPVGEMTAHMLVVFAQFERRLIGERTSAGMQEKKRQDPSKRFGHESTLPGEVVERITLERAAGRSYRSIAAGLNGLEGGEKVATGQGGAQWWAATVRGVCQRAAH